MTEGLDEPFFRSRQEMFGVAGVIAGSIISTKVVHSIGDQLGIPTMVNRGLTLGAFVGTVMLGRKIGEVVQGFGEMIEHKTDSIYDNTLPSTTE